MSSSLNLVGHQLWRGAFLLADYILHNQSAFETETIIELGSGIGLTSIAASMVAKEVISSDVDIGDILKLIECNIERNKHLVKCPTSVLSLDFYATEWDKVLEDKLKSVTTIIAADVVYHEKLTEAFCVTLDKLLSKPGPRKTAYIALEKRYVFTIEDLDTAAYCYNHFCELLQGNRNLDADLVTIDFPQYFNYERTKELTLWRITAKNG